MASDVHTFPISLRLDGIPCLVVGGHRVALQKVESLVLAGAVVTVVAPDIDEQIDALGAVSHRRTYNAGEAGKYQLVIAATGIAAIDQSVARDARAAQVFVNVVDNFVESSFVFPAIFRRGHLSVAVSSDGMSPAFARWLRDELAAATGAEVEQLFSLIAEIRLRVKNDGQSSEGREWRRLIEMTAGAYRSGGIETARSTAEDFTASWFLPTREPGLDQGERANRE